MWKRLLIWSLTIFLRRGCEAFFNTVLSAALLRGDAWRAGPDKWLPEG